MATATRRAYWIKEFERENRELRHAIQNLKSAEFSSRLISYAYSCETVAASL